MEALQSFEISILDFINNNWHNPALDFIMPIASNLVNKGIIWIALGIIFLIFPKTRKIGTAVMLAIILEVIVVTLIMKPAFDRIRPFEINPNIDFLVGRPHDGSFPSGHTGASFAAATAILLNDRRLGIAAMIFAFIVGFSRLYLYMHFPTDVLGGMIVGVILGWVSVKVLRRRELND